MVILSYAKQLQHEAKFLYKKNRPSIDIIADMLSVAKEWRKKTHIMYKANLSTGLLKIYLKKVRDAGLLILNKDDKTYHTTDKGEDFLSRHANYKKNVKKLKDELGRVLRLDAELNKMCEPIRSQ